MPRSEYKPNWSYWIYEFFNKDKCEPFYVQSWAQLVICKSLQQRPDGVFFNPNRYKIEFASSSEHDLAFHED